MPRMVCLSAACRRSPLSDRSVLAATPEGLEGIVVIVRATARSDAVDHTYREYLGPLLRLAILLLWQTAT